MKTLALVCLAGIATSVGCAKEASPSEPPQAAVAPAAGQIDVMRLHVEGLTCEGCAWQIRDALQKVPGISGVQASVPERVVFVEYDATRVDAARVLKELDQIGYKVTLLPQ